jgi:hypothetical protein
MFRLAGRNEPHPKLFATKHFKPKGTTATSAPLSTFQEQLSLLYPRLSTLRERMADLSGTFHRSIRNTRTTLQEHGLAEKWLISAESESKIQALTP